MKLLQSPSIIPEGIPYMAGLHVKTSRCVVAILLCHAASQLLEGRLPLLRKRQYFAGRADLHLNLSFGQSFAADDDPDRNSDQIVIFELHTRSFVAIIEKHLDPELFETEVYLFSSGHDTGVLGVDGYHRTVKGGDRNGENDAVFVVALLDRRATVPR